MLGKLLKYEILATARVFLPLYAGLMLVSIISSFILGTDVVLLNVLFGFLLSVLYGALIIITIIILVQRFYQNFH